MEDEPRYARSALITLGCWIAAGTALALGWTVWLLDGSTSLAVVLAGTTGFLSGIAAVLHLRCYHDRTLRMLRLLLVPDRPDAEVRRLGHHR